jgi:C-terminal processing protease CtpA/Prc
MFFNQKSYDRFHLTKAELEVVKKAEDDAKKEKEKAKAAEKDKDKKPDDKDKKPDDKDKDKADDAAKPDPSEIDLKNIEDRKDRLSINSSRLMDYALTPDGEQLVYLSRTDEGFSVWQNKLREKETKQLAELPEGQANTLLGDDAPAQLIIDKEGKTAFVLAGGAMMKVDLGSGKPEPVKYSAQMNLDRSAERAYIFEHVWRLMKENFYVADMNGVDWDGYKAIYQKFLPFIANNYDFSELLSEMLGELNASHTGSGFRPTPRGADDTAALGVFYEESYHGAGLQVAEIIEGGPLQAAKSKIVAGMIIEKINGVAIEPGADWCPLLNHQAGRPTLLGVFDPAKNVRFDETVKPIKLGEENELLYKRWVKSRRELTDKLSGGKIGYLHIAEMNDASYRETVSELLGRDSGKEGILVDTRFNGGGNLHDELVTLLSGHDYLQFVPRGQEIGWEPVNKWTKKSAVLISESNYSDAHLFPWIYRDLGIGKLVGMPVPGTGTAVWWEQQQDPTLYFGMPEVAFRDSKGDLMEHANIEPDVKVENDAHSVAQGEDKQLEAGVKLLLGQ